MHVKRSEGISPTCCQPVLCESVKKKHHRAFDCHMSLHMSSIEQQTVVVKGAVQYIGHRIAPNYAVGVTIPYVRENLLAIPCVMMGALK